MNKNIFLLLTMMIVCTGLVFGAECGVNPVSGCTISNSTVFNISGSPYNLNTDGIYFNADNVILDCNNAVLNCNSSLEGECIITQYSNVIIKNCYINNSYNGIYIQGGASDVKVEDNTIANAEGNSIVAEEGSFTVHNNDFLTFVEHGIAIEGELFSNINITNNYFDAGNNDNIALRTCNNCSNVIIAHNTFENGNTAITVDSYNFNVDVFNNTIHNMNPSDQRGIDIEFGSDDIDVYDNYIDLNYGQGGDYGIGIEGCEEQSEEPDEPCYNEVIFVTNARVYNNTILNCGNETAGNDLKCIFIINSENILVSGNIISGEIVDGKRCVHAFGSNDVSFIDNDISSCYIGIQPDETEPVIFIGNNISSCYTGIDGAGDDTIVDSNEFSDCVYGFSMDNPTNLNITNNYFHDFDTVTDGENLGINAYGTFDNVLVQYNRFERVHQGMKLGSNSGGKVIVDSNNVTQSQYGFAFERLENVNVTNNRITEPAVIIDGEFKGISFREMNGGLLIDNNYIDYNYMGYPTISSSSGGKLWVIQSDGGASDVIISNNEFYRIGNFSYPLTTEFKSNQWFLGLQVESITNLVIHDNIFEDITAFAMQVQDNTDVEIYGNTITRTGGIKSLRNIGTVSIHDNTVKYGSPIWSGGIECNDGACNVTNNNIQYHCFALNGYQDANSIWDYNYVANMTYNYLGANSSYCSQDRADHAVIRGVNSDNNIFRDNTFILTDEKLWNADADSTNNEVSGNTFKYLNCSYESNYLIDSGSGNTLGDVCTNYNIVGNPTFNYITDTDTIDIGIIPSLTIDWSTVTGTGFSYTLFIDNGTSVEERTGVTLPYILNFSELGVGSYDFTLLAVTVNEWSLVDEIAITLEDNYVQGEAIIENTIVEASFNVTESPTLENNDTGTTIDFTATTGVGIVASSEYTEIPSTVTALDIHIETVDVFVSGGITGSVTITQEYDEPSLPSAVNENQLRMFAWYNDQWNLGTNQVLDTGANTISADFLVSNLDGAPVGLGYAGDTFISGADLPVVAMDVLGEAGTQLKINMPLLILAFVSLIITGYLAVTMRKLE